MDYPTAEQAARRLAEELLDYDTLQHTRDVVRRVEERYGEHTPHTLTAVAWLHDVLEDTRLTGNTLALLGFPTAVTAAVEALTRSPTMNYGNYIEFVVRKNPVATFVKIADLKSNIARCNEVIEADDSRGRVKPRTARSLKRRYERWLSYLEEVPL